MASACIQGQLFGGPLLPICMATATTYYVAVREYAAGDYICSPTAAGSVSGACCGAGDPPTCVDVANDYVDCKPDNLFIPRLTCAEVATTLGGCPVPANDECSNATRVCANLAPDPGLGRCCSPDECDFVPPSICFIDTQDCNNSEPCTPNTGDVYRCAVVTDNRLALTDGPPSSFVDAVTGVDPFQGDVWLQYVAPCDGALTIENCDSTSYDSVIEIYGGNQAGADCQCPLDSSTSLASDDDGCGKAGAGSSLYFPCATANSCFLIRVGGYSPDGTAAGAPRGATRIRIGMICGPCNPLAPSLPIP